MIEIFASHSQIDVQSALIISATLFLLGHYPHCGLTSDSIFVSFNSAARSVNEISCGYKRISHLPGAVTRVLREF